MKNPKDGSAKDSKQSPFESDPPIDMREAEEILDGLAKVFFLSPSTTPPAAVAVEAAELPDLEARFRTLVEQIPAVIFMASLDGGTGEAYVSPHIEEMLGFTQTEWLNDPVRWYKHIHPEDQARWSAEAAELFLTGKSLRSEYRVLARDGRVVWFHCEVKMVRGRTGQPWFIHGVAFDITEHKQAEEALRLSEAKFSGILSIAADAIISVDESQKIALFNEGAEKIFGYRADEVSGKPLDILIPNQYRSAHTNHVREFSSSGVAARRMGERQEIFARRKSGEEFAAEASISKLEINGEKIYTVVLRDVTNRKLAEEELRKARDELEIRVQERTAALSRANAELQAEVAERKRIEEALREAHDQLEIRVQERTAELARSNRVLQNEIAERKKAEVALRTSEAALKRRGEDLRALTASLLSIQDEERRRIARELHDGTAQNLAALAMNFFILLDSPAAQAEASLRNLLKDSLTITEQCSREIRSLSYLLHPPLLDELGLASALKTYVEGFNQRTGIKVELKLPPRLSRMASEVEMALFRIIQEALVNIHRHSGSLRAFIRLALSDSEVSLEVKDDGAGVVSKQKAQNAGRGAQLGVGIPGMRERAQQLGGQMDIDFSDSGTRVTVTLPLRSGVWGQ